MSGHFGNTMQCFKAMCYFKTFSMLRSDMPLLWVPSRKILMHIMPFWHRWFTSLFAVDIFTDFSSVIPFEWVQIIRLYDDIGCHWAENYFTRKSTNLTAKLGLLRCFKAGEDFADKSFLQVKTKERIRGWKVWTYSKSTPMSIFHVRSLLFLHFTSSFVPFCSR